MRKHTFGKLAAAAVLVGGAAAAVSRLLKLRGEREHEYDGFDDEEFDDEAFSGKTERTYVPLTPKTAGTDDHSDAAQETCTDETEHADCAEPSDNAEQNLSENENEADDAADSETDGSDHAEPSEADTQTEAILSEEAELSEEEAVEDILAESETAEAVED